MIDRATAACRESGFEPADHFAGAGKMVGLGSGAVRRVIDVHMSRRGCYLTAMSGDSRKPAIVAARGRLYFNCGPSAQPPSPAGNDSF